MIFNTAYVNPSFLYCYYIMDLKCSLRVHVSPQCEAFVKWWKFLEARPAGRSLQSSVVPLKGTADFCPFLNPLRLIFLCHEFCYDIGLTFDSTPWVQPVIG